MSVFSHMSDLGGCLTASSAREPLPNCGKYTVARYENSRVLTGEHSYCIIMTNI